MNNEFTGRVIVFNNAGRYGFIRDSAGRDIFAHASQIITTGYKTLVPNELVSYRLVSGPRGLQACNVTRLAEKNRF